MNYNIDFWINILIVILSILAIIVLIILCLDDFVAKKNKKKK